MQNLRLFHAVRLAFRGLRRAPAIILVAALTLGISFTAVAILLGVLFGARRTLPVPDGENVMRVDVVDAHGDAIAPRANDIGQWTQISGIESGAALRIVGGTLVREGVAAVRTSGAQLSADAFPLLGVQPITGRWPTSDAADARAIVLSASLFDPAAGDMPRVGAEVRIDDEVYNVVAVMPEGFGFPERQSYWTVLPSDAIAEQVVVRIRAGARRDDVGARVAALVSGVNDSPELARPVRALVRPWSTGRGEGGEATAFAGLAVLVAVLVAICATNVSLLLMVRATERAGTLAVHAALGAARAHIALVLFLEALFASLAGGILGAGGGVFALAAIEQRLSPHWGYYWMRMDAPPAVFAGLLAVVLIAAIAAGTLPALRASRVDLRRVMADSVSTGTRARWRGRMMVWSQVTLSTVGLVAALLLGAGVHRIGNSISNLPLDNVATALITPGAHYDDPAARSLLIERVREQLMTVPDVRAASVTIGMPGMGSATSRVQMANDTSSVEAGWFAGDQGALETWGIRLLRGRAFTSSDGAHASRVALVSESFAAARGERGDVIGTSVRIASVHGEQEWAEVVGVVADWAPENARTRAGVIIPVTQATSSSYRIAVATSDPAALVPQLRSAIARVDATVAVEEPSTLRDFAEWLVRMPRALAGFGVLGGVTGVVVAGIGLYAMMAYQVRGRRHEFGVRLAIGASSTDIARDVVREALVRVLPPVALGTLFSWAGMGALGFLAGSATRSPMYYLAAAAGMFTVAIVAALAPALHASRLNPLAVLRR